MGLGLLLATLYGFKGTAMTQGESERQELLQKAEAAINKAVPEAEKDPKRPTFHFRPPAQWMNDPNGPIFYKGWYHVFYQFNPYGDGWGNMHWGHARSRDLVNWEQLPIALWPSKAKGEEHVYSGSTFLNGAGKPTILYTSIGDKRDPEQWAATPLDDDLLAWTKSDRNPVVSTKIHAPTKIDEWRDPFLFTQEGKTYMLTGGKLDGKGIVALYESTTLDLTGWTYKGVLFTHPNADDVECPNFAKIGDKWVLLVSVHGRVEWFAGSLDAEMRFRSARSGVLHEGSYASQLLADEKGRCVHLAWIKTDGTKGWNGCLTLPSVLTLGPDGNLRSEPIAALKTLRGGDLQLADVELNGETNLSDMIGGDRLEIEAEIDPGAATQIRIRLGGREIAYDPQKRELSVPGRTPAVLSGMENGAPLKLHLYLDGGVLDVYADGGSYSASSFALAHPGDKGLSISAEGGKARLVSLKAYTLRKAKFDSRVGR